MTVYGPRARVDAHDIMHDPGLATGTHYVNDVKTPAGTWPTTPLKSVTSRYTEDVVNEGFKRRQAAGEIFNNPFLSIKSDEVRPGATPYYSRYARYNSLGVDTYIWEGTLCPDITIPDYLALPAVDAAAMKQDVIDKAVTQAYGNRSLVTMATTMALAEGRKTVQGAYEILFRVVQIAKAAKRLDLRYLRDELSPSELTNRYMELRYAIRPLVIDMNNIVKAANHADFSKARKTARGGQSDRVVQSDFIQSNYSYIQTDYTRTSAHICKARAGVLCDVQPSPANIWGVDQLVETVWEVIPWSFILGWFVDVASFISSWTPKSGVKELASWVTVREIQTQTVTMTGSRDTRIITLPQLLETEIRWSGQCFKSTVTTQRIPNPVKSYWPSIDVNLDTLKLLDLGIILKGFLTGKLEKLWR